MTAEPSNYIRTRRGGDVSTPSLNREVLPVTGSHRPRPENSMDDVSLDAVWDVCPSCNYRSYVYDDEFKAFTCEWCGHWQDEEPLDDWI